MPIYAYRCEQCGFEKDVLQKLSDAPLSACPSCGADAFRKKVSAPAFQLKGSGWYVTDFRDGGKAKSAGTSGSEGQAESSSTSGEGKASTGGSEPASPTGNSGASASQDGGGKSASGTSSGSSA
ncbi:MAG: FmdB family zinc ribbon protein [Burkholderiaceae bacterium]